MIDEHWRCSICGKTGPGGHWSWAHHYHRYHYTETKN